MVPTSLPSSPLKDKEILSRTQSLIPAGNVNNDQLLNKLNGEIDAITENIKEKELEWKTATTKEKAVYLESIRSLEKRLEALMSTRDRMIPNAPSSSQGKDISMAVFHAKFCSR